MAELKEDRSLLYIKTPQEMSRYELAELEKEIKEMDGEKNEEEDEEEEELTEEQKLE